MNRDNSRVKKKNKKIIDGFVQSLSLSLSQILCIFLIIKSLYFVSLNEYRRILFYSILTLIIAFLSVLFPTDFFSLTHYFYQTHIPTNILQEIQAVSNPVTIKIPVVFTSWHPNIEGDRATWHRLA